MKLVKAGFPDVTIDTTQPGHLQQVQMWETQGYAIEAPANSGATLADLPPVLAVGKIEAATRQQAKQERAKVREVNGSYTTDLPAGTIVTGVIQPGPTGDIEACFYKKRANSGSQNNFFVKMQYDFAPLGKVGVKANVLESDQMPDNLKAGQTVSFEVVELPERNGVKARVFQYKA